MSKSLKNLKGLNSCKGHWFGGTFTKALILRQKTRVSVKALIVFEALFTGSRSSLKTTFKQLLSRQELLILNMFFYLGVGFRIKFLFTTGKTRYKACQVRRQEKFRLSLVFNGAKSSQNVRDLSFWRKECQRAYSNNLTICSLTSLKIKQHFILTKSLLG